MNAPAHNVKTIFPTTENGKINLGVIKHHWWLGSGIMDKNGIEIFEGDKVKTPDNEIVRVRFENGVIGLVVYESKGAHPYLMTGGGQRRRSPFLAPLYIFGDKLEVVGHIAQD